nr:tetratricopeptide repeat-containing sensor histidine kinase [Chryseobacterium sp. EO14]
MLPRSIFIAFFLAASSLWSQSRYGQQRGYEKEIQNLIEKSDETSYPLEKRISLAFAAYQKSKKISEDGWLLKTSEQLAGLYEEAGRYDSIKKYIKISFGIAQKRKDIACLGRLEVIQGNYYYEKNESSPQAYYHYQSAQRFFNITRDSLSIAKNYLRIAILEKNGRDFFRSKESSFLALTYVGKDKRIRSSICNNLGIVYDELGDLTKSLQYHHHSLSLRRALNVPRLEIQTLNNIGTAYKDHRNYEKAALYYQKALTYDSIAEKYNEEYARIIDNRAHLHLLQGKNSSLQDLKKALEIRLKDEDHSGVVMSCLHLGEYYLKKDSLDPAITYAGKSYEFAVKDHNYRDALQGLKLLSAIYENKKDYKKALEYSSRYNHLLERLHKEEIKLQEKFADIRYTSRQLKKDNAYLKNESRLQSSLKRLWTGVALLLFFLSLVLFLWMRQKLKNKNLRYQKKEQELSEDIYTLMLDNEQKLGEGRRMERSRIMKELHDGVINELYGIRIAMEGLNDDPDIQRKQLRYSYIQKINDTENQIKNIVNDMGFQLPFSNGFTSMLRHLFESKKMFSISIIHNAEKIEWDIVPSFIKMNIYRIIQETLHNTIKHSGAGQYRLEFLHKDDLLQLIISDNGTASSQISNSHGMGIHNIKHRIRLMQGVVQISTIKSFTYTIEIPLSANQN